VFPADLSSWATYVEKPVTDWMKRVPDRSGNESVALFASFGLNGEDDDYEALWETLRTAPAYCCIHRCGWLIQSGGDAPKIRDILRSRIGCNDSVVVFPADLSDWASFRLSSGTTGWLQKASNVQDQRDSWKKCAQDQMKIYTSIRILDIENQMLQGYSQWMNNSNAEWRELWARQREAEHRQNMRRLGAGCANCRCMCCCCH
jgi:hypothetical protein